MPHLDHKRQGEEAELAFALKVWRLGFSLAKPYGDSARYDFIVDAFGRLSRVQVKSAGVMQQGSYHIASGSGHRSKTAYTERDIDLLAAYILPEDAWYLIPVSAFSPIKTLRLCPHCPNHSRFEQFREAWHLLAPP